MVNYLKTLGYTEVETFVSGQITKTGEDVCDVVFAKVLSSLVLLSHLKLLADFKYRRSSLYETVSYLRNNSQPKLICLSTSTHMNYSLVFDKLISWFLGAATLFEILHNLQRKRGKVLETTTETIGGISSSMTM